MALGRIKKSTHQSIWSLASDSQVAENLNVSIAEENMMSYIETEEKNSRDGEKCFWDLR